VRASSPWAVRAVPRIAPKVSMGRPGSTGCAAPRALYRRNSNNCRGGARQDDPCLNTAHAFSRARAFARAEDGRLLTSAVKIGISVGWSADGNTALDDFHSFAAAQRGRTLGEADSSARTAEIATQCRILAPAQWPLGICRCTHQTSREPILNCCHHSGFSPTFGQ
jgi:hypothetical protein